MAASLKQSNLSKKKPSRPNFSLILALLVFLGSAALLGLSLYLYFQPDVSLSSKSSATSRALTPTAIVRNINPAVPPGFAIQANPNLVTPVVTPTVSDSARALAQAQQYFFEGRFADAATAYQAVIDKFPQSDEARPALYGLARTHQDASQFTEAADAFKKYLAAYPNDPLRRYCYYALGIVSKQQGYWDEALSYFQKYQADQPGQVPLDGYADYEVADIYNNLGKPQPAIEAYKKIDTSPTSNLVRVTAFERVADDFMRGNNPAAAVEWYSKILQVSKVQDYRADIMVKQAKAFVTAGQLAKAVAINRELIDTYLDTDSGFATLKELFKTNSPVLDDFQRGYYLLLSNDPTGAIPFFNRFLGRADDKIAAPFVAPGMPKAEQEHLARAWFLLASAYEAKDDPTRAGGEYFALLARFPNAPTSPEALWRLAGVAEKQNQPDQAFGLYGDLARRFPTDKLAEESLLAQARLSPSKEPEALQPIYEALAHQFPTSSRLGSLFYNLGKAYQAKGNTTAARTVFQKAVGSPVPDFYAVRAGERLQNSYDPNNPPRSTKDTYPAVYNPAIFATDIERDRRLMEAWLSEWLTPTKTITTTKPASVAAIKEAVNNDGGIRRMIELKQVGRYSQATREAREALDRFTDSPVELYALATILSEQGEYYYSIQTAEQLLRLYQKQHPNTGVRDVPLFLQKLIYPLPYQSLILEQSGHYDFDPLLMVGMLRQESSFDADATSGAGARGLSQIMPETGNGIAASLGITNFNTDQLYLPYVGVQFGAYYLANRLKDFDGNPYEALASYNGGAGNVYRWSKAFPPTQNFDQWVENIDFGETRTYVQIIYANYFMYRQIYHIK